MACGVFGVDTIPPRFPKAVASPLESRDGMCLFRFQESHMSGKMKLDLGDKTAALLSLSNSRPLFANILAKMRRFYLRIVSPTGRFLNTMPYIRKYDFET